MTGETANGTTTIIINGNDLIVLRMMQKISPDVVRFIEAGVFDFKSGRVIIHRDFEGKLRKIDIEITKFKT